jgi:mannosylglycoprotein endo-beta-mannosidase
MQVEVRFCGADGKLRDDLATNFSTPAIDPGTVFPMVGSLTMFPNPDFLVVRMTLKCSDGTVLATNLDWIAGTAPADPEHPYAPLRSLPNVILDVTAQGRRDRRGRSRVDINVSNTTDTLAFFNRIRVWQSDLQTLLAPVFRSGNYFSVLPNEQSAVTLEFRSSPKQGTPIITLTGWNSSPGTPGDVVGVN